MYPLAIAQPYRSLLMFLLGAWLAALIGAFVFGKYNEQRTRHSNTWLLMSTSALLVGAAFIWWLNGAGILAGISLWLFLGMTASFAGDMILANHIPFLKGTLPGMAAFAVAHVCYLLALSALASGLGLNSLSTGLVLVGGYLVTGVVLWFALVNSPKTARVLNYGALGYTLLLAGMAGFATALAVQAPALFPLALGANLFLLSDILLGHQLFRQTNWPHIHDIVWVLYICGQALIVFSNSALARLIAR